MSLLDFYLVYSNLKDNRQVQKPNFFLGRIVRTADIKRVFSKGDSKNYSYKLYTITEIIHDTILSYKWTIYSRNKMKIHYYLQNCLLMKIIKF